MINNVTCNVLSTRLACGCYEHSQRSIPFYVVPSQINDTILCSFVEREHSSQHPLFATLASTGYLQKIRAISEILKQPDVINKVVAVVAVVAVTGSAMLDGTTGIGNGTCST